MSKARRQFKQYLERKQDRPFVVPGLLGAPSGLVHVPGRRHYVYVRLAGSTAEVFNNRVTATYDLPVLCGYDPIDPRRFQVLSIQGAIAEQGGFDAGGMGYAPASRYRWMYPGGGQDPLFVELRQVMPLRVSPAGGLSIYVYPGMIQLPQGWTLIGGATSIDLSAHIPVTSGKALFVLIGIDSGGNITVTPGGEVNIEDLGQENIPAPPAGTQYVLAAVRLYYGQTAIQEGRSNTDIADLRLPLYHRHEHADLPPDGTVRIDGIGVALDGIEDGQAIVYDESLDLLVPGGAAFDLGAIHVDQSGEINGLTEKTNLDDDDLFVIEDSEASFEKKKLRAANLPGGGGGSDFELLFSEPFINLSNWTAISGTWSASGNILSKTSSGFAVLRLDAQQWIGSCICEFEIRWPNDPDQFSNIGLLHGWDGTTANNADGAIFVRIARNSMSPLFLCEIEKAGQYNYGSVSLGSFTANNWYKIQVHFLSNFVTCYVDNARRLSINPVGNLPSFTQARYLGLRVGDASGFAVDVRNFKVWTPKVMG